MYLHVGFSKDLSEEIFPGDLPGRATRPYSHTHRVYGVPDRTEINHQFSSVDEIEAEAPEAIMGSSPKPT